jgi:hypothetical protein
MFLRNVALDVGALCMISQLELDFPLTGKLSPPKVGVGKSNLLLHSKNLFMTLGVKTLLLFFVSYVPVSALAETLKYTIPQNYCLVLRSERMAESVFKSAISRLQEHFSGACRIGMLKMEDPFSENALNLWKEEQQNSELAFWFDMSKDGKDALIRGLDLTLPSRFEFSSVRVTLVGLSDNIIDQVVRNAITEVLESLGLPTETIVGYVHRGQFFTWAKREPKRVTLVRRTGTERHPFLPVILQYSLMSAGAGNGILTPEGEKAWRLDLSDNSRRFGAEKLWLAEKKSKSHE